MPTVNLSPIFNGWQGLTNGGLPLAGGKIYTYLAGTSTPAATYTTAAGNIANPNPIVLDASGRPFDEIWLVATQAYLFALKDASDVQIDTFDDIQGVDSRLRADLASTASASNGALLVGGLTQGKVNVRWYPGADSTGSTDSSAAFTTARATGHANYVPAGTWKANASYPAKIRIEGDGSYTSQLRATSTATAVMTYTAGSPFWTYQSEVNGVGFYGSAKTGVGYTFAKTNPTSYAIGDEYVNNVRFVGVYTDNLDKGIQFPFGNIGSSLYDCGSSTNAYGYYLLDSKFAGTDLMHAGNKYWYAGETNTNTCGVYINNATDGFGGVAFRDHIFEQNQVAVYCKTSSIYTPVVFDNVWLEANGFLHDGTANVTLDTWTGSTKSTASFVNHALIFDGTLGVYNYNGGFFTDCHVKGTNIQVTSRGSRVEQVTGVNGRPCVVDNADSVIHVVDPSTDSGLPTGNRVIVSGIVNQLARFTIDNSPTNAGARAWYGPHRTHIRPSRSSVGLTRRMQTAESTSGSISVTGTIVSDGVLFPTCNEFALNFTTGGTEFAGINNTSVSMTAGWWVATVDVKATVGTPLFGIFNGAGDTIFGLDVPIPSLGEWHTLVFMGKAPGAMSSANLRVRSSSIALCTLRMSALQWQRFDTKHEAQLYVASGAFSDVAQSGGPITVTGATYTVTDGDKHLIFNRAGTVTVTLPPFLTNGGRELTLRTITANTVVSAASDVVPAAGGAAGTAILAATAGKSTLLVCDGASWQNQLPSI